MDEPRPNLPAYVATGDVFPLAYLITFRAYGTWLHGDKRGSVDRLHNRFGAPRIAANKRWEKHNRNALKDAPVRLGARARPIIKKAVRETCSIRKWDVWTTNVRTNHVHTVVSAMCKPETVLAALKANATRRLREAGLWRSCKVRGLFAEARDIYGANKM